MPSREIPGNTLAGGDGIRLLIYCEGSAAAGLENAWGVFFGTGFLFFLCAAEL